MFCPECGKKIEEGALFCPECGTKITKQAQPQPADSAPPQEASAPAASPNPEQAAEPTQTPASTAANASATEQPAAEPSQAAPTQNEAAQPKYEGETAGAKAGKVIDDTMSKFKSLDKTKKYGIVGGGIAAVVLVAIIAFVMPLFGGVPTDVARHKARLPPTAQFPATTPTHPPTKSRISGLTSRKMPWLATIPIRVKWPKPGTAPISLKPFTSQAPLPTKASKRTSLANAASRTSMAPGAKLPTIQ